MRCQLEEHKKSFMKELNKRDPDWQERIKQRRLIEIKKLENLHNQVKRDAEQRIEMMADDRVINDRLTKIKEDFAHESKQRVNIQSK